MNLSALAARRRSCRSFLARPVDDADVEALLALGRRGDDGWAHPSAHDRRPVRLSVVPDDVDRAELEAAVLDAQPWLVEAPVVLALTARLDEVVSEFADQDRDGLRGRDFAMVEAGAVAQTVLLACGERDLGAVLVAGVRQKALRRVLATGDHVVGLIALGHPTDRTA